MKAYFLRGSLGNDFVVLATDQFEAEKKAHHASGCDCQGDDLELWIADEITEVPQRTN